MTDKLITNSSDTDKALMEKAREYADCKMWRNSNPEIVRGKKGSWITLAEYKQDVNYNWKPVCVKSAQIDGKKIKEDTWYKLENAEFVEVV